MAGINSTPSDFYVYLHRRATDGRVFYVGKGIARRAWKKDNRNKHWHHISKKHGYTVEIVQYGMQEWWAFELERELICSYGRDVLCNLTDGGEGATGVKFTDEQKNKISAHQKTTWTSERRQVASLRMKNAWRNKEFSQLAIKAMRQQASTPEAFEKKSKSQKGVKKSKQMSERLSLSLKGKKRSNQNQRENARKQMVSVKCVETGMVFDAVIAAARWVKIANNNPKAQDSYIGRAAKSGIHKAYGYTWKYQDENS